MLNKLFFLGGFLDLGEAIEIGVGGELGWDRAFGAKEQECEFFEACFALGSQQARPPILIGKIFSGEGEFFEVVLQQKPGTLGVDANGEVAKKFFALGDGGFRVGEFPPQIRECAVSLA